MVEDGHVFIHDADDIRTAVAVNVPDGDHLAAAAEVRKRVAFLSDKTMDRHVSNIFVKTGVSSRAAATAYADKQRLG
jgi:hypothetical protein